MADADDVRRIARSLAGAVEIPSDGFDFRVLNRGFVWSYPEHVPGRRRVIRTDLAVIYVGDESERRALLNGEPELFQVAAGYGDQPVVVLRLDGVGADRLVELITDAWDMRRSDGAGGSLEAPR
jgi:hypothetical protein